MITAHILSRYVPENILLLISLLLVDFTDSESLSFVGLMTMFLGFVCWSKLCRLALCKAKMDTLRVNWRVPATLSGLILEKLQSIYCAVYES